MSLVIKKYYEENNIPDFLLKQKLARFEKNADIATEFEYWIKHKEYNMTEAVEIEGYTAKLLSEKSTYLAGEGAFIMLIELRENPQKAKEQLLKGFKRK